MSEFGETFFKARGLAQASSAYEESLALFRALAAKDPNQIAWQRGMADQMEHIGVLLQKQGALDQAMENFRTALELREAIVRREPANAISYRDLASAKYNIGEVLMARRNAGRCTRGCPSCRSRAETARAVVGTAGTARSGGYRAGRRSRMDST
jgi:tetratricopeptide (TPR) repeat protein